MREEDLRTFAERDRTEVEREKARYWLEHKRRRGPAEALRIADELRRHIQALRPDWPSPEERDADLETHIRVSRLLRRVPRDGVP